MSCRTDGRWPRPVHRFLLYIQSEGRRTWWVEAISGRIPRAKASLIACTDSVPARPAPPQGDTADCRTSPGEEEDAPQNGLPDLTLIVLDATETEPS